MGQFNAPSEFVAVIQELQNRLDSLERVRVTHGNGAPPTGGTEPYVDDTNSRLYFKVAGVWKSAALA